MGLKKKNKIKLTNQPFSKKTVIYARLEAYVFSLILIVLVFLDKDVSAIAGLITVSWAGYRALGSIYLWVIKHEHLMDKKIEYKKLELDSDMIDEELTNLESENFEVENCE